jgi:hypothetical protein
VDLREAPAQPTAVAPKGRRLRSLLWIPMLCLACRSTRPAARSVTDSLVGVPAAGAPIIRKPTVVAFQLPATDTLAEGDSLELLDDFRAYTAQVAPALERADIELIATTADSIIVELTGGPRRVIRLGGLDYPFGYVLVEPGYAESILTGVSTDAELLDQVGWYFGLDEDDADSLSGQVVSAPVLPGPAGSASSARTACAETRCWATASHAEGSRHRYSLRRRES